jgi:hypothetical protein
VDLEEVDICGIETLEGGVNCIEDCLTGETYSPFISGLESGR